MSGSFETSIGGTTTVGMDGAAPTPTRVTIASSSLVFNLDWDSSVATAPAGFMTDVIAAAQYLESQISDAVTINIDVGYGEIGGSALQGNALGESNGNDVAQSYSNLLSALAATGSADATDASVLASLPPASPVDGTYFITTAQAKALGLEPANSNASDGEVGFAPASEFTYGDTNTTGTVAAGSYDMFGVITHELTEIMGRLLFTGGDGSGDYALLDLLHYSSSGTSDYSSSTPGYFSVDGGATNLGAFNTSPSGDSGDWASSVTDNSFDAFSSSGVLNVVTSNDLTEMDAIGWNLTGSILPFRDFYWTGASNNNFSTAKNWNDATDGDNPALTAPGTTDLAVITNGGSIIGGGTVYELSFTGTNTVAGTLTAIDTLTEDSGSSAVTGTVTVAGLRLDGTLTALSGGRVRSNGTAYLASGAVISADGSSSVEIGIRNRRGRRYHGRCRGRLHLWRRHTGRVGGQ